MNDTKANILVYGLIALALAALAALAMHPARAEDAFKAPCNVGLSLGANAMASRLDDGSTSISIGTQNMLGGFEVGCAYFMGHSTGTWGLHGIGRVDLTNTSADLSITSLKSNTRWMALGGLSYELNKNVSLMALGGVAQTRWSLQDIQASQSLGLVYGGRINMDIGQSALALFAEIDRIQWRGLDLGAARIKPDETIARIGVTLSLGK